MGNTSRTWVYLDSDFLSTNKMGRTASTKPRRECIVMVDIHQSARYLRDEMKRLGVGIISVRSEANLYEQGDWKNVVTMHIEAEFFSGADESPNASEPRLTRSRQSWPEPSP